MRYFQIPHDIVVRDRASNRTEILSFVKYANLIWLNDVRWETPKSNLARLVKVVEQLDKAPGEVAALEDQDWKIVANIINVPGNGPNGPNLLVPLVQIQVGPTFEGAVLNATEKDPREAVASNGRVDANAAPAV